MSIKILTDSASDITKEDAQKLGIEVIPLIINFGEQEYFDGVDLTNQQFFEKLMNDKNHPKTSQVSPYRFKEMFEKLTKNGDQVVYVGLSSKLSGTFESAVNASQEFKDKVFVVDSLSATVGERLLCEYAVNLVDKGLSAKEIKQQLDDIKKNLVVMGVLDTLEYLKRGGRISKAVALVGGALKVKPVMELIDGQVKMIGKAIGKRRGRAFMNDQVVKKGGINFDMPYCVLWSGIDQMIALEYLSESKKIFDTTRVKFYSLGSTIGTHVGPGVVGVAFFKN